MGDAPEHVPSLLNATSLAESDVGSCEWDADPRSSLLSVSNDGLTIEWGPTRPEYERRLRTPAWIPVPTRLRLHSGTFRWDVVVEEMARAQMGIGFLLLWDVGPDWGFFGYLGASPTAWAYDPSTGDVVCDTKSIQAGLSRFADGRTGVVSVQLDLPRHAEGSGSFRVGGRDSRRIALPAGAVVMPAACLLRESQRVTLARYERG